VSALTRLSEEKTHSGQPEKVGKAMRLKAIGKNQTEIERADGSTVFFSYNTPVAVFVPGKGGIVTSKKWSVTTSRHINATIERWGCSRSEVEQAEIDRLAEGVTA